jgi:hypothetical protein
MLPGASLQPNLNSIKWVPHEDSHGASHTATRKVKNVVAEVMDFLLFDGWHCMFFPIPELLRLQGSDHA